MFVKLQITDIDQCYQTTAYQKRSRSALIIVSTKDKYYEKTTKSLY